MTLIADSGSTKTTWMEIESGNTLVTEGLNPHFTSDAQFLAACQLVKGDTLSSTTALQWSPSPKLGEGDTEGGRRSVSVYFYGAGCGSKVQRQRVKTLLQKAFETKNVHVETDMLGACRAVCGDQPGIVGILGTGSNACYYDGKKIKYQEISTGYILGDFGSANHVGRVLLNDYLTHRMSPNLRSKFRKTYQMSDDQLMDALYHQPHPNRFLASLAPFAVQNISNFYFYKIISNTLVDWWIEVLLKLIQKVDNPEIKLHIVGGYAKAIEPTLRYWMEDCGATVDTVMADPIDGLRQYHK